MIGPVSFLPLSFVIWGDAESQVFKDRVFSGHFLMEWLYRAVGFSLCLYVYIGYKPDFQASCSVGKAEPHVSL